MKNQSGLRKSLPLLVVLLAAMPEPALLQAQMTGAEFRLDPTLVSGSGGLLVAGGFRATGTFGQPVTSDSSGGALRIEGGFWPAAGPFDRIFANGFQP